VDYDFDPIGYSELIENTEEVVPHRVLANVQFSGNFAVRVALGQPADHILFPLGKQISASNVRDVPDVTIMSEQLDGKPGRGFEVLSELRTASPGTRTVMLLDSAECGLVVEAFRRGARGAFTRSDPLKMLSRCIRKVHDGQLWIGGAQLEFLLEALTQTPARLEIGSR
jgi:DNA-binding NarL/FixJ family response regulator